MAAARGGDQRAVARLISLVENGSDLLPQLSSILVGQVGGAHIIGLTGAPGVGKSTCTAALVSAFRAAGKRVGVLAVDPSSPFSGGALLGDRVRMQDFATDPQVFIRSMATRGHLGGLSLAAPQALRVLDGVGCEVILLETVGVGQGEVEVAGLADTTLVLLAPGMGDGIQAAKAGVLEIADIFVVNKADRDGADHTVRDLKNMLALGGEHSKPDSWRPMIVSTVASRARLDRYGDDDGSGVSELVAAIEKHFDWLASHEVLEQRRRARAAAEIESIVLAQMRRRIAAVRGRDALLVLAREAADGELDPFVAAERLGAAIDAERSA